MAICICMAEGVYGYIAIWLYSYKAFEKFKEVYMYSIV